MSASFTLDEAFAHCEERARGHYENFPVGLFVPKPKRRYVHALYAFMRVADDFADEAIYEGVRRRKLDEWEARLHAAYDGRAEGPIFMALAETVQRLQIPKQPLLDLLSAFKQDTEKDRYETWDELLDYCRRSADPVGRLVLAVFEQRDPELPPLSDAVCTALQLANHWQDLAVDLKKDRIYVPRELLASHGVPEWDLNAGRLTDGFRALMRELISRTRPLFERGRPLCDRVSRELRFEMRLTWLGGSGILDGIERAGYDVFRRRPHYGLAGKLGLAWRAWRWKGILTRG
ncbi:MAG TPA: squalene synthase HpnC [Vicinamibacteria bacterium]|nr:squalene synthase HpnC [Vicinamibacteria bacterium]